MARLVQSIAKAAAAAAAVAVAHTQSHLTPKYICPAVLYLLSLVLSWCNRSDGWFSQRCMLYTASSNRPRCSNTQAWHWTQTRYRSTHALLWPLPVSLQHCQYHSVALQITCVLHSLCKLLLLHLSLSQLATSPPLSPPPPLAPLPHPRVWTAASKGRWSWSQD